MTDKTAAVSGGKVVAWLVENDLGQMAFVHRSDAYDHVDYDRALGREVTITPLTNATDLAAAIAERDKLRSLCACAYQMAGYHDAPIQWLDALSDAANGTPLSNWRVQAEDLSDALLPYSPDSEALEAAIARAEALRAAGRRVTDAFRAHGKAKGLVADARTERECIAAMVALDEAIAAQQAEGEDRG